MKYKCLILAIFYVLLLHGNLEHTKTNKPMLIEIIRVETTEYGTLGVLRINGQVFGNTLELPHKENKTNISSIPTGQYWVKKYDSPKHGWVWKLENVPGRTYIELHSGNTIKHTAGCILVGESEAKLRGPNSHTRLKNSGRTFARFMMALDGQKHHKLVIKENY